MALQTHGIHHRIGRTTALILACAATVAACGESTVSVPSSGTREVAPLTVSRSERVWTDDTRPTARNGSFPGAPNRTLRTLLWLSSSAHPQPLFIMAHGFTGLPEKFEAMAHAIATAGFVVAAPAFPLTNQEAPGGQVGNIQEVAHQPADVSFLISALLDANATPGDALHDRIVPTHIAALGHSLGGTTVTALTRKACCRDPRVAATILFAPGPVDFFRNRFGDDPIAAGPPTLILQGHRDPIISLGSSQNLYAQFDPPRFLVGIPEADHSDAIEARTEPLTDVQQVTQRSIVTFLNAVFHGAGSEFAHTLDALAAEGNLVQRDGTVP